MKKLFKKVQTTKTNGDEKSMEKTMDEITSQIMEEHDAAVEAFMNDKVLEEEEAIKDEYLEELAATQKEHMDKYEMYRAGRKDGMLLVAKGLAVGVAAIGLYATNYINKK